MATRTVEWSSANKLACSQCLPADVILCIRPELLPQPLDYYEFTTLEASLTIVTAGRSCDCLGQYRYTFEYDDADLVEGSELICSDITGAICMGCMTAWVLDQLALASLPPN